MGMKLLHIVAVSSLVSGTLVAGCAPRYAGPYSPRASYGEPYYADDRRSYTAETDERYCRRVAEDVSGDIVREGAKGAIVGGAFRDADPAGLVVGKVLTRTVLGVATLSISELEILRTKEGEALQTYCDHVRALGARGQMSVAEAEGLCLAQTQAVNNAAAVRAANMGDAFRRAGESYNQSMQNRRPVTCYTVAAVTTCY